MPRIERTAAVRWVGNVARGAGTIDGGSGAIEGLPFTLASRIGTPDGKTSPEELVAAATGACYAMSLGTELAQAGTPAERLAVDARCVMDEVGGHHLVTEVQLVVRGTVPGLDAEAFAAVARRAEDVCPIAHLVKGTAAVTLSAYLDES